MAKNTAAKQAFFNFDFLILNYFSITFATKK